MLCLKFSMTPARSACERISCVREAAGGLASNRLIPAGVNRLLRGSVVTILAALAGCATTHLPQLAPPVPATWRHTMATTAPAIDLRGWWHAFHDRRLDALVDTALHDNLDVAAAQEHLLAARVMLRSVNAQFLPSLSAKTNDAIDPDASESFFVAGFDALWELPLFGRDRASRRQAHGSLDATVADLQSVRVSLVGDVVRNWLELRSGTQKTQLLITIRDAREKQLSLLHVRMKLQLAAPSAIAQAEAAVARASAAVDESRQSTDVSAQALATLLGRSMPDPAWLQAGDLADLGSLQLTSTPADLLSTRPEISRARAGVLSAAGDAGIARADMYPTLGIGGSIVWATTLTTNRKSKENAIASIGPLIDIPLFDWGMRQAQSHAKNHELRAAVFAYRQAVLVGVAEVENALGALEHQRRQEQRSHVVMKALADERDSAAKRVRLGLDNPLDQLDSVVASEQAQLEVNQARTARGVAFVSLYKALGGAPLPDGVSEQTTSEDWH